MRSVLLLAAFLLCAILVVAVIKAANWHEENEGDDAARAIPAVAYRASG